ncbi:MAG: hypothetical protein Q4F71_00720 [Paracoccus sp. (in: a-proteobacteria)]|nr:hypothetical protein [Paracoccus sp. (in: a-proteobacteria)]
MIKDSAADLGVSVSQFLLAAVSKNKPYLPMHLIQELGVIGAALDRLSHQNVHRGHETIAMLAELVRIENALTKIADRITTS